MGLIDREKNSNPSYAGRLLAANPIRIRFNRYNRQEYFPNPVEIKDDRRSLLMIVPTHEIDISVHVED